MTTANCRAPSRKSEKAFKEPTVGQTLPRFFWRARLVEREYFGVRLAKVIPVFDGTVAELREECDLKQRR